MKRPQRLWVAGLLAWVLGGCAAPPAPPPVTRRVIRLANAPDGPPGMRAPVGRDRAVDLVVDVPDGPWLADASLQFEGLIGRALVTLDEGEPVEAIGGPGLTTLPLPGLAAGPHRIRIFTGPASEVSPVLIGGDGPRSPVLGNDPLLVLRPAAHVEALALPMDEAGVSGRALVAGAPAGAVVHFVVSLDGEVLQDLGRAPVIDGEARTAPLRWRQARWSLGRPALYMVHALLEDGGGTVLDALGQRMGARSVTLTDQAFRVGEAARLVASRSGPGVDPPLVIQDALAQGTNSVEFHGTPPSRGQLLALDEVGFGAVLTHRCDGALRRALSNEEIVRQIRQHELALAAQDRRLAWAMARHPSVVLWVTESVAEPRLAQLMVEVDPERRPVVGADLPLMTVMDGAGRRVRSEPGGFVVESAWNGPMGASKDLAAGFLEALDQGARGGVVEHSRDAERIGAWAEALAVLDLPVPGLEGRRAQTELALAGAPPGALAQLEGPWLVSEAAVVDAQGRAHLDTWYQGPATLRVGDAAAPIELQAATWNARAERSPPQQAGPP